MPALGYGDGIDVRLRYFREIDDEIGEADDDLLKLPKIGRLLSPNAPQHLVDAGFLHHQSREGLVKGRQPDREILQDFRSPSSPSEKDDRPEFLVFLRAEDQLIVNVLDHLLDSDTHYRRVREDYPGPWRAKRRIRPGACCPNGSR